MTHIEENIVNIAMRAGELLKDGRIQRDDISGHTGMIQSILTLAELFEKKNTGVDYDAEGRDYWLEIDEFAEAKLLELYGVENVQTPQPLNIKVIFNEGIVEEVLKNQDAAVEVEVLDIDQDYEDFEQLDGYRKELYADPSFLRCDYTVARFDEEPEVNLSDGPVKVFAVAGSVRKEIFSGDWDECSKFCEDNFWRHVDENRFQWDLELIDEREPSFPEGYYDAIDHFSVSADINIENEYVRQHAEELVYCYVNNKDLSDFDYWTRFETLLGEKLSFQEACAFSAQFDCDPHDIQPDDISSIEGFKNFLAGFRVAHNERPSLDAMIQAASQISNKEPAVESQRTAGKEVAR